MTNYFGDTSAVAKRYLPEVGTSWVLSWILPATGNVVVISELTVVEMFSLLARRQREGSLSPAHVTLLQSNFLFHTEKEYLVVPVDSLILMRARDLCN